MNKHNRNLPKQKKNKQGSSDAEQQIVSYERLTFAGPIPPPQVLDQYNKIVPGAADRILVMAENQSKHRIKIEAKVINSDVINSRVGQLLGFILALALLGTGAYFAYLGAIKTGGILIGTTLISLVGTFVYGSRQRREERSQDQPTPTTHS